MICRRYLPEDRAACLALFDSNIPASFADDERPRFAAFLDRNEVPYLMIEDADGRVIACGGLAVQGIEGRLCWGMVDERLHRRGVGTLLLDVRVGMACNAPSVTEVTMDTSHETAGFFARYGFTTLRVLENHYRQGLHRHDMRLALDAPARSAVQQRLEASQAAGHRIEQGILEVFRDR
jgi:N-acetylglutamate synthase-like GNAT family acetyltransferase